MHAHRLVHPVELSAHELGEDLSQRDDGPPENEELAADVEQLLLHFALVGKLLAEDPVLELFEVVLGPISGVEVAVDQLVEEDVEEKPWAGGVRSGPLEALAPRV